jgi:hypothetical protein
MRASSDPTLMNQTHKEERSSAEPGEKRGIVCDFVNCGNHKLKAMISCGVGLLGRASR